MLISKYLLPSLLVCSVVTTASAQQTATSPPQPSAVLQSSLLALAGPQNLTDVTLSGTARRIAGSDDESGAVILKALADGSAKIQLSLPSGNRSESRSSDSSGPAGAAAGAWSGPDGAAHPIASHNLVADSGFFPAFTLAAFVNSPSAVLTYIGPETKSGQSVLHLKAAQQFSTLPKDAAALFQHLSETDIFLDAATLLPAAIAFNIHPDNNALLDIPVEMQFSDYRSVNGAQIPFHIQKFINNTLTLDLQFTTAAVNSGLSPALFTVGARVGAGLQPGSCFPSVNSGVSSADFVVAGLLTPSRAGWSGSSPSSVGAGLQPGSPPPPRSPPALRPSAPSAAAQTSSTSLT